VKRLAIPLIAALALAACGGEDDSPEDVEQAIRSWAKAANERDAEAFCNGVTQGFAERVSGASGENARKECEELFDVTQPGLKITILDVKEIEIDGDRANALVRRRLSGAGESEQLFRLRKEDGEFRVASSGGE
jgi:ketosteroid isomerase-like protein